MLNEAGSVIGRIAETVGPSVVGIGSRGPVGSGFVYDAGTLVTNAHNVHGGSISVTLADGGSADAEAIHVDVDRDLAVMSVDTGQSPAAAWSEDPAPPLGTPVVALSNPGGRGLRVTLGFVSGVDRTFRGPRGRRIGGAIEHTAPLLPGSSGGPLVDLDGRLIGVNTHRLGEGFYLAMAAGADLRERIELLAGGEAPNPVRLGIAVTPGFVARRMRRAVGLPDVDGVLIRSVDDDSPAQRAGLVRGDLIVAVGERDVTDIDDLHAALEQVGAEATVTVVRGAEQLQVSVTLG